MKCFVVNMARDVDKRAAILLRTSKAGLDDVEIVEAIDGNRIDSIEPSSYDYKAFIKRHGILATYPALGCALSHRKVCEEVIRNGSPALVLEDDALLHPDISTFLDVISSEIDIDVPTVILLSPIFDYNDKSAKPILDRKIVDVTRGQSTTGFVITPPAAKLIMKIQTPVSHLADDWSAFMRQGLVLKGIVPHLTSYSPEPGEITRSQIEALRRKPLRALRGRIGQTKGNILYLFRHLKGEKKSRRIWP